jgi:hypothetical protein
MTSPSLVRARTWKSPQLKAINCFGPLADVRIAESSFLDLVKAIVTDFLNINFSGEEYDSFKAVYLAPFTGELF